MNMHKFMNIHKKATATATCDKAGQPNDVCPCGQVMSALPCDVANGCVSVQKGRENLVLF